MSNREVPTMESVRNTRQHLAKNEAYLHGEHRGYANAKERAMKTLELAGGNPGISAAEHRSIVERRGAFLVSEIGKATDLGTKQGLAEQLRSLAEQAEDPRFDIAEEVGEIIVSSEDEIVTVELMLLELREERRKYIENLRQVIDVTSDPNVILECCALIEEDIAASLAAGDTDGARRSSASLIAVRSLIKQEESSVEQRESDEDQEAQAIAASLVAQRDIRVEDSVWAVQTAKKYRKQYSGLPNAEERTLRSLLSEYKNIGRRADANRPVDPDTAFKGGFRWS